MALDGRGSGAPPGGGSWRRRLPAAAVASVHCSTWPLLLAADLLGQFLLAHLRTTLDVQPPGLVVQLLLGHRADVDVALSRRLLARRLGSLSLGGPQLLAQRPQEVIIEGVSQLREQLLLFLLDVVAHVGDQRLNLV